MRNYVICLIAGVSLGAVLVYNFYPRTVTKTVEHETTTDHIVVQTHTVVSPDHTTTTDSTTTSDVVKVDTQVSSMSVAPKLPQWQVSGLYGINRREYSVELQRRLLGNVWVGLEAGTEGTINAVLSFQF